MKANGDKKHDKRRSGGDAEGQSDEHRMKQNASLEKQALEKELLLFLFGRHLVGRKAGFHHISRDVIGPWSMILMLWPAD